METKIQNLFTFKGRMNRLPYFKFTVTIWLISALITNLADSADSLIFSLLGFALLMLCLATAISVGVRRLHDLDKSGWFLLVSLIPLIGFIFEIYLLCAKGTDGANRYGANPAKY